MTRVRIDRGLALMSLGLLCATGCYGGARAARDVNEAWTGRTRTAIEARWGQPDAVARDGRDTVLRWIHTTRHVELPSGHAEITIEPGHIEGSASYRSGAVHESSTVVAARVDAGGVITRVRGPSLRWGPPGDANLRWGLLLGLHAGMGRLDDTGTPLPGGGLYIGGMIARTLGLVGCFSLASGSDDAGGAMGFSWGMAAQWWPAARLWLRAGPALVLDFDPGFENAALGPGVTTGASYAIVRSGSFVLDLRADVTASRSATFGTVGIGVNIN